MRNIRNGLAMLLVFMLVFSLIPISSFSEDYQVVTGTYKPGFLHKAKIYFGDASGNPVQDFNLKVGQSTDIRVFVTANDAQSSDISLGYVAFEVKIDNTKFDISQSADNGSAVIGINTATLGQKKARFNADSSPKTYGKGKMAGIVTITPVSTITADTEFLELGFTTNQFGGLNPADNLNAEIFYTTSRIKAVVPKVAKALDLTKITNAITSKKIGDTVTLPTSLDVSTSDPVGAVNGKVNVTWDPATVDKKVLNQTFTGTVEEDTTSGIDDVALNDVAKAGGIEVKEGNKIVVDVVLAKATAYDTLTAYAFTTDYNKSAADVQTALLAAKSSVDVTFNGVVVNYPITAWTAPSPYNPKATSGTQTFTATLGVSPDAGIVNPTPALAYTANVTVGAKGTLEAKTVVAPNAIINKFVQKTPVHDATSLGLPAKLTVATDQYDDPVPLTPLKEVNVTWTLTGFDSQLFDTAQTINGTLSAGDMAIAAGATQPTISVTLQKQPAHTTPDNGAKEVAYGTSKDDVIAGLPATMAVAYTGGINVTFNKVNWVCADYDPIVPGVYTFTGTAGLTPSPTGDASLADTTILPFYTYAVTVGPQGQKSVKDTTRIVYNAILTVPAPTSDAVKAAIIADPALAKSTITYDIIKADGSNSGEGTEEVVLDWANYTFTDADLNNFTAPGTYSLSKRVNYIYDTGDVSATDTRKKYAFKDDNCKSVRIELNISYATKDFKINNGAITTPFPTTFATDGKVKATIAAGTNATASNSTLYAVVYDSSDNVIEIQSKPFTAFADLEFTIAKKADAKKVVFELITGIGTGTAKIMASPSIVAGVAAQ